MARPVTPHQALEIWRRATLAGVRGAEPDLTQRQMALLLTVYLAPAPHTVRGLAATPRFLIAKGGITSSDTATRGLDVRRAIVRGQLLPGVPVWRLGPESRFPGLDYVVFPGNVGGESALVEAVEKFSPVRPS